MSEIPEDITEKAKFIWKLNPRDCKGEIAKAIWDERQRAAKIAPPKPQTHIKKESKHYGTRQCQYG